MTDWVHCNKCFCKPQPNGAKFFLKECGRIECQKCLNPTGEGASNCATCKRTCNTILLANNVKPEIQTYFKPIMNLIDTTKKVYEFQKKNYDNLFNHLHQKYNFTKNEIMRCYKVIDTQKKEISKMKAMLKSGQFQTPSRFSTSTPLESQTSPSFYDASLSTVSNVGSLYKKQCIRPGFPHRIYSDQTQSFSTVSSAEQAVPVVAKPLPAPTHKNSHHSTLSTLSQMMQNSHFRRRQI